MNLVKLSSLTYCRQLTELGTQGHLCNLQEIHDKTLNVRLGTLKHNLLEAEPYCRNQDAVLLHLDAIQYASIPGHASSGPAGFSSEEITQLFRYFGFNDKLKALHILDYHQDRDIDQQTAALIAQCIWYYCEALDQCISENLQVSEDYTEFIVEIQGMDEAIQFLKAKRTGRWWMKSMHDEHLIPCSYQDYLTACKNEIPDRIFE